jgi:hypothetical protein
MVGINAQLNDLFQANNKIIYTNMQSERTVITDTMSTAVSAKVDLVVTQAVTRALQEFATMHPTSGAPTPPCAREFVIWTRMETSP